MIEPRIVESGPRKLVGLSRVMTFGDPAMRELWQSFRTMLPSIPRRASEDFVSMRIFDPPPKESLRPDSRFEQWAAVEVDDFDGAPRSLKTHTVPGGSYAVFEYRGTAADFASTAELIYRHWLPSSPFELVPREFFEILGPDYRPDDPEATEDVWIPVQERA